MRLDKRHSRSLTAHPWPRCHRLLRFKGCCPRQSLYPADLHTGRYPLRSFVIAGDIKKGTLAGPPQFLCLPACVTHVLLLPCFQAIPGPNAFLDECEALISVSVEDGSLGESQVRDLLASFGHLQSFYPSGGVRTSREICSLVPVQLTGCSPSTILQSILTLGVPRRSSITHTTYASPVLVSEPNLSPIKSSFTIPPQRVLLRNLAESVHAV